jgi:hypothetical protein
MSRSKRHKVKTHSWIRGILETFVYEFSTFEDALNFVIRNRHRNVKIYDIDDVLVYVITEGIVEIYA